MKNQAVEQRMKQTWDALARKNAMHFIATDRDNWDVESFLQSGADTVNHILTEVLGTLPQARVGVALDLGCGIGRLSFALARFFDKVIAVDASAEMVKRGKQLGAELGYSGVEFYCNNGHDLSFVESDSCDLAFSFIVLQHIPQKNIVLGYIKELARVVKPEGHIIFQLPIYQERPVIYPWQFAQTIFRSLLWPIETLGLIPPEKGVAFRGSRLRLRQLEYVFQESNLQLLTIKRRPTTYRFCDDALICCQKAL